MKKYRFYVYAIAVALSALALQSCDDDDEYDDSLLRPTALVTVIPADDESFIMQLDNTTSLNPVNMQKSPFGMKEVRALVNYSEVNASAKSSSRDVHVNWIDSIRTKMPVPSLGEDNDEQYGDDPIEIVKDWVTIAEDGYLTLRVRTLWGQNNVKHTLNLLTDVNADNPYELELRHDANGDVNGVVGDALIAFNLNELPRTEGDNVKIKLNWKSFSGDKSAEFDLQLRPTIQDDGLEDATYNSYVK